MVYLALAIAMLSLFLCGVGVGMSIWALAFALKRLVWKDSKDRGNGGDDSGNEG